MVARRSSTPRSWRSRRRVSGSPARVVTGAEPGRRGLVATATSRRGSSSSSPTARGAPWTRRATSASRIAARGRRRPGLCPTPRTSWRSRARPDEDGVKIRRPRTSDLPPTPYGEDGLPAGRQVGPRRSCRVAPHWSCSPAPAVPLAKVVRRSRRRRTASWSGSTSTAGRRCSTPRATAGRPCPRAWSRVAQARALGAGARPRPPGRRSSLRARTAATSADGARVLGRLPRLRSELLARTPARQPAGGRASTPPRCSPGGRAGVATTQSPRRCATKIAVPGVSSPRARDHPPHTRSWCSGHSGSTRSVSMKP